MIVVGEVIGQEIKPSRIILPVWITKGARVVFVVYFHDFIIDLRFEMYQAK